MFVDDLMLIKVNQQNKYVGLVRWYYRLKDASYGMIYHSTLGDLLFNGKISGKRPTQFSYEEKKEIKVPRLLGAAKEFNIGQDTLIDFLISKGFPQEQLRPTSKLTEKMYATLMLEFYDDKMKAKKSENIVVTFALSTTANIHELRSNNLQNIPKIFTLINKDKRKAIDVKLLSHEHNLNFLLEQLLFYFSQSFIDKKDEIIQDTISERFFVLVRELNESTITKDLQNEYHAVLKKQLLTENKANPTFLIGILKICKVLFPEDYRVHHFLFQSF